VSDTPSPQRARTNDSAPPAATLGEPSARHSPTMALKPGVVVGGYRIERTIGHGGMGRVYLAHDERLSRQVALKVLPPEEADDEARARFLREAQALARVQHENVVQVYASGSDGDIAWMALEYVEGDALGALLAGPADGDEGGVDEETALSLCAQAARGLAAVHEVGVVHRDVKPDNLLMDRAGVLRVLDFGVAVFVEAGRGGFVTQAGVAIGTPHFMAPEQARGGAVDARADAWGLGATLYALLVGRPPFYLHDDESDLDILARLLRERAPDVRAKKPAVSGATAALIARLLEPDLEKRERDLTLIADELLAIGDALARGEAPPAPQDTSVGAEPAPSASTDAASSSPREPVPAWLATAGVVTVAALFLVLGVTLGPALRPAPRSADAGVSLRAPEPAPAAIVVQAPPVEPAPAPPLTLEPPPSAPTPEEVAASIVRHPESNLAAIKGLVDDTNPDARTTLALVLADPGEAGDMALSVIAAKGARQHVALVGGVLRTGRPDRALAAISVLQELKSESALALLNDAATSHPNARVRDRARAASAELFRVE
jgi:serine/threonine protein kinase